MYSINCNGLQKSKYEINELVKMFLRPSVYHLLEEFDKSETDDICLCIPSDVTDKNEAKRYLYKELSKLTGKSPAWGILTGVRPVKLATEFLKNGLTYEETSLRLQKDYLVSKEKIALLLELCENQSHITEDKSQRAVGIYIGIPFCPTRCVYCSFTSNQGTSKQITAYLAALLREIAYVGAELKRGGYYPELIYVGGGTPTTLSAEELSSLLLAIDLSFDLSKTREFTVEAGRPDTITKEKLAVIKSHKADRISINPQSMKEHTLKLIGRSHTPQQILEAFRLAKEIGIPHINADLIAGLPEESPADFAQSLKQVIRLEPDNITVHTLAVKRASKLKELDEEYNYEQGNSVGEMLNFSGEILRKNGYRPYYMYRQKQMTGNFENIGYAKKGSESLYNIRIMAENQTIIALGAGGISKVYYPAENRLERIPNVSNYEIYINRLDEMLARKEKGIFSEMNGGPI